MKKIKIINKKVWDHHHSGWGYVMNHIESRLSICNGVLFEGALDDYFNQGHLPFTEPWVGFMHNTPFGPPHIIKSYPKFQDVNTIVKSKPFQECKHLCKGLFVLSDYLKNFLQTITNIPVSSLKHPTLFVTEQFDFSKFNKQIVVIGQWLRRYENFYNLRSPYEKYILNWSDQDYLSGLLRSQNIHKNKSVNIMSKLDNDHFDQLLSHSIVFLDLYDSSANNSIIECIVRHTPMLINRLPAVEEYLGKEYPLFFESVEDANIKLNNFNLIQSAHEYLRQMDKTELRVNYFITQMQNSDVYSKLKMPPNKLFV